MTQGSSSTCGSCGGGLAADARFCPACGAEVPKVCPRCGASRTSQARFCPWCGAGFADGPSAARAAPWAAPVSGPVAGLPAAFVPGAPRRRGRRWPAVLLALVAVAVVVAGGFVILRPSNSSSFDTGSLPPIQETKPITGHLTLGAETPVATQTVGASGGTITSGGFEIQIPDGTLSADTKFDIKQAPITGNEFSALVTPLTPLYLVDDGDALFKSPVTVTLPATIPEGATAMAFSYDDASGTITPLIPIAQDAGTLTVGAMHFSGFFGGLLDPAGELTSPDSGFRPGYDDWQFPNPGAYVAPDGICEGKSLTEIWYYDTQVLHHKDAPHLYGLSDNNGVKPGTPDLWLDDSQGYRFASSVQADPIADSATYYSFRPPRTEADTRYTDRATYETFRAAIIATGQPQLISIGAQDATHGHAMVVYSVAPDRLYVADPNYPGFKHNPRWIPYNASTGRLGPYSSGANSDDIAADGEISYTRFGYEPAPARVSDASIATHWGEYKAGQAGVYAFPDYDLEVGTKDAQGHLWWQPLDGDYEATASTITIRITDPRSKDNTAIGVYYGTSSVLAVPLGPQIELKLTPGANPVGIMEWGAKPGWKKYKYVNFVRLNITLPPTASAGPSVGAGQYSALAVRMEIAGQNVRSTDLSNLKIVMTGQRTFKLGPGETRIKSLTGETAPDGKSVTVTITYLDDPSVPAMASCPNETILKNIPLKSTDPSTGTQTFFVSGWDAIMATIQDSYPYSLGGSPVRCMTTAGWHFNSDANPNPAVYVILGN